MFFFLSGRGPSSSEQQLTIHPSSFQVYNYATTDPQRLADYFDKYYERLLAACSQNQPWIYHNGNRMLAPPNKSAPTVFLINKQIFQEAASLFFQGRRNVSFNHGLLEFAQIREVVTPHILQRMTSLTISDSGHNEIIQLYNAGVTKSLPCSWNGYVRLITQLGTGLSASGHQLQSFTIDFSRDTRLGEHMNACWKSNHVCGFRDQLRTALDTLRGIRGVRCVTLIGLNEEYAAQLKARMESFPVNFSDMPEHVRKIIYGHALGWNDISGTIMRAVAGRPEMKKKSFPYPLLTTPTILLMNKQFSAEAINVLNDSKQMLKFDLPAGHNIKPADMPKLSRFIGRTTLKTVRAIEIKMQSRDWLESLDRHFLSALASPSSKLKSFDLVFLDDQIGRQWPEYPDHYLHQYLNNLRSIRGLENAHFSGTLPLCYTDPLASAMTTPYRTRLPKMRVVRRGTVADMDDAHRVAQ